MTDPIETPVPMDEFLELLGSCLGHALDANVSTGLIIIQFTDLDRMMSTHGFRAGNRAAVEYARRLVSGIRDHDTVVRISESKFAVVINKLRNPGVLILAANKLGAICRTPTQVADEEISLRVHMGIASGSAATDPETLHRNAEIALLTAISDDTDYAVFAPGQRERASESLQLENELDKAIKDRSFEVHYQPKVSAVDFRPCGAEALLRWNSPQRGPVSPDVFIPLADRPGHMEPLTSFVLSTAIRHALDWAAPLPVSVNVSTGMLLNSELVEMVGNALGMWDFEPARLYLEVTEGALMADPDASLSVLNSLRELGVRISIDDFGTGYSSLAYFKSIPATELKIDKSFVLNMLQDEGDKRIVDAVIQLSKGFRMQVTAEGVEDEQTARALAQLGCDILQGFHFARPMPHDDFLTWLAEHEARKFA